MQSVPPVPALPQPYVGAEPFVFVSYARKDGETAHAEIARLGALGCRAWYDRGIRGASVWTAELASAIQRCHLFVVLLSPNAVASKNVCDEIHFAHKKDKPILAIHLAPTDLPDEIDFKLSRIQALLKHLWPEAEYADKLCECLPPEVFAVVTPRELAARELATQLGDALSVAGVSGAAVHALYLRHVPDGWHPVRPQGDAARALAAATADLLRAPVRRDGRVPELELLVGAAALAPEPARTALLDAVRAGAVAQGAPDPVPAPAPASEPAALAPMYLTIAV
jgi:hypothetical protein